MNRWLIAVAVIVACLSTDVNSACIKTQLKMLLPIYSQVVLDDALLAQVTYAGNNVPVDLIIDHIRCFVEVTTQASSTAAITTSTGTTTISQNTAYHAALNTLKTVQHVYLLGFVETNDGARDINLVKTDIYDYSTAPIEYRVDGIFFDNIAQSISDTSDPNYYQTLYDYTKSVFGSSAKALVADPTLNDANSAVAFASSDIVVITEQCSNLANPSNQLTAVALMDKSKLAIILTGCSDATQMRSAIDTLKAAHFISVFVTDKLDRVNNYLPAYFQDEVDYIHQLNTA